MKYADGTEVKLGDRVKLGEDESGIVVCSIDTSQYADGFPERQWAYAELACVRSPNSFAATHTRRSLWRNGTPANLLHTSSQIGSRTHG